MSINVPSQREKEAYARRDAVQADTDTKRSAIDVLADEARDEGMVLAPCPDCDGQGGDIVHDGVEDRWCDCERCGTLGMVKVEAELHSSECSEAERR